MFELRVESGSDKGRVFALCEGVNSIGRGAKNSCPINDSFVSRSHCVITVRGDRAVMENKSRHGTLVAGTPIEAPLPLTDGQRIQLGYSSTEISFHTVVDHGGSIEAVEPTSGLAAAPVEMSAAEPLSSRRLSVDGAGVAEKPSKDDSFVSGFKPVGGIERRKPEESVNSQELVPKAIPPIERKSGGAANDEDVESEFLVFQDANALTDTPSEGSAFIPIEKLFANLGPTEPLTRIDNLGLVHDLRQMEIKKRRMRVASIVAILFGLGVVLAVLIWWI